MVSAEDVDHLLELVFDEMLLELYFGSETIAEAAPAPVPAVDEVDLVDGGEEAVLVSAADDQEVRAIQCQTHRVYFEREFVIKSLPLVIVHVVPFDEIDQLLVFVETPEDVDFGLEDELAMSVPAHFETADLVELLLLLDDIADELIVEFDAVLLLVFLVLVLQSHSLLLLFHVHFPLRGDVLFIHSLAVRALNRQRLRHTIAPAYQLVSLNYLHRVQNCSLTILSIFTIICYHLIYYLAIIYLSVIAYTSNYK